MNGTKIVTALIFLSLATVGCRAKFTTKNAPNSSVQPTGSAVGPVIPQPLVPPPVEQQQPPPLTPVADRLPPIANDVVPQRPMVPQVQVPPQNTTAPHPAVSAPACPTSGDQTIDPRRAVQQKTIVFRQGRQMVWRKNCDGVVISKTFENLTRATSQIVTVRPRGGAESMMIINRTTCDTPSLQAQQRLASRDGSFRIAVSIQPSNNTLLVKPGKNLIDYEIPGGERGTLVLNVRLSNQEGDCIVLNARNCAPRRQTTWADTVFVDGN